MSSATRTLVRSSSHAFAASLVGVTLGLALSIVVARALGPHDKGAYDLVVATAMLLSLVLGLSIPSGITFSIARQVSAARPLVVLVFGAGAVQGLVTALVLAFVSTTSIADDVGSSASDSFLRIVVPGLVAVYCIASSLKAILIGRQRVALASWLDIVGRAITLPILVLIGVGVVGGGPTVDRFAAATLIGGVVGTLVILRSVLLLDPTPNGKAGLNRSCASQLPLTPRTSFSISIIDSTYFLSRTSVGSRKSGCTLWPPRSPSSYGLCLERLPQRSSLGWAQGWMSRTKLRYAQLHLHAAYSRFKLR